MDPAVNLHVYLVMIFGLRLALALLNRELHRQAHWDKLEATSVDLGTPSSPKDRLRAIPSTRNRLRSDDIAFSYAVNLLDASLSRLKNTLTVLFALSIVD